MPNRVTSIGFHLAAAGFLQDVWFSSAVAYRDNNMRLGLTALPSVGNVLHKTDSGRRDCIWSHADAVIPGNVDGATGTVTVAYLYSNTAYDIQDSAQRTALLAQLTPTKNQATLRTDPAGVGQYRYWYLTLTSLNGSQDASVAEYGAVQMITQPVEYGAVVVLVVDRLDPETRIVVARKTTPTIPFIYSTTVDGVARYNIDGATLSLRVARTAATARAGNFLIASTPITVDDGSMGEASIVLTELQTTLDAGTYTAEVELTKGGLKIRHLLPFIVTDALS